MSKIAGKLVNGLKTLAKKVTTKSFPQKDVKKFVTSMPTIKEVCGKEASKAVVEQAKLAKNISPEFARILESVHADTAINKYAATKCMYRIYGVPMPKILNNKMTVAERIKYLQEFFNARQQRKADLAKAFLGVNINAEKFVK